MKLEDEYNILMQARRAEGDRVVAEAIGEPPSFLYEISGAGYGVKQWLVESVRADIRPIPGAWFNKRPSRKTIAIVKSAPMPTARDICYFVKLDNSKAGANLDAIGKHWFLTRAEAEAKATALRAVYIAKDGQFNCKYCRKATDTSKKLKRRVISRSYPGMGKEFDYCSLECASHDQMAHEG